MPIAGYCAVCRKNVWVDDEWRCEQGHAADQVSEWYDSATGQWVTRPSAPPRPPPPPPRTQAPATVPAPPAIRDGIQRLLRDSQLEIPDPDVTAARAGDGSYRITVWSDEENRILWYWEARDEDVPDPGLRGELRRLAHGAGFEARSALYPRVATASR